MNREEFQQQVLNNTKYKCMILELATGFGKTKLALDICNSYHKSLNILIVVPRVVHKESWKEEINKWYKESTNTFEFVCYASIDKTKLSEYDIVICDEAHHLSERCRTVLTSFQIKNNLLILSATLSKDLKKWLDNTYNCVLFKADLQDAIESDVLPEPTIVLVPLRINGYAKTETIVRNPKLNNAIEVPYEEFNKYLFRKDIKVICYCTRQQYLDSLNAQIEWYKSKTMSGCEWAKFTWLKLCGDRLKWLASLKNDCVKAILRSVKDYRTLTFCSSIKQTEELGKNCINSKNKKSATILEQFNSKKIKHITSCNMLDEGVNLSECKIGILVNINSSERIVIQRIGRLLRHRDPVIYIPYFLETREEELVKKMVEGYKKIKYGYTVPMPCK